MSGLPIEVPSKGFSDEQRGYLARQFVRIDISLRAANRLDVRYTMPLKYNIGEIFYFAGAIPTTAITSEGVWVYRSDGWSKLG